MSHWRWGFVMGLRSTYIFSFGYKFGVTWLVQDIRHKFGLFNFFIKFVILSFLHQWLLYKAYRFEESFYVHASLEGKFLRFIHSLFVDNKKGKKYCGGMAWIKGKTYLFHSGRCLHLNLSTSSREVRTRLCLFCHHQIGEDCWDSWFDVTK